MFSSANESAHAIIRRTLFEWFGPVDNGYNPGLNIRGCVASITCFEAGNAVENLEDLWTHKTALGTVAKCFSVIHYDLTEEIFRGLE
jgi:hypothetical protein